MARLGPVQAVPAEPGEVDPLLEVDVHPARRRGEAEGGAGRDPDIVRLPLLGITNPKTCAV